MYQSFYKGLEQFSYRNVLFPKYYYTIIKNKIYFDGIMFIENIINVIFILEF